MLERGHTLQITLQFQPFYIIKIVIFETNYSISAYFNSPKIKESSFTIYDITGYTKFDLGIIQVSGGQGHLSWWTLVC